MNFLSNLLDSFIADVLIPLITKMRNWVRREIVDDDPWDVDTLYPQADDLSFPELEEGDLQDSVEPEFDPDSSLGLDSSIGDTSSDSSFERVYIGRAFRLEKAVTRRSQWL